MSTGNGKKTADEVRAVGLRFEKGRLVVELADEREVSVPLRRYPTLQRAKLADRKSFRLIGQGAGFHWPALDLDLSTEGLVNGLPERIPAPPALPGKRAARRARGAA
jgi:hypothetical protein